jgi:hypothetical protein
MSSEFYTNDRIESVTLKGEHTGDMFDMFVMLKSGESKIVRLNGIDILRDYGAYLTAMDRKRLLRRKGHKHHHWWCSVM